MTRKVTPLVVLAWLGIVGGTIASLMDSRVGLPWWSYVVLGVLALAALTVTALRHRAGDVVGIAAAVVGAAGAVTLFTQIDVYPRYALLFAGLCLLAVALVGAFSRSEADTGRPLVAARS